MPTRKNAHRLSLLSENQVQQDDDEQRHAHEPQDYAGHVELSFR
jgi:hypothetical protein